MRYSDMKDVFKSEQGPGGVKASRRTAAFPLPLLLVCLLLIIGSLPFLGEMVEDESCVETVPVCGWVAVQDCQLGPCPLSPRLFNNYCEVREQGADYSDEQKCLAAIAPKESPDSKISAVRVVDGDTFDLEGVRIRIYGIDAVELNQKCNGPKQEPWNCGLEAKKKLNAIIANQKVLCEELTKDIYGRSVAKCFVGNVDIADALVSSGYAVAYRRYSSDYIAAERQAKKSRVGIWQGSFVSPEDWRKKRYAKSKKK